MHKGPLIAFGRLSENTAFDYPTQFSLVLKDTSTQAEGEGTRVTVWNRMCELSYEALKVGDLPAMRRTLHLKWE